MLALVAFPGASAVSFIESFEGLVVATLLHQHHALTHQRQRVERISRGRRLFLVFFLFGAAGGCSALAFEQVRPPARAIEIQTVAAIRRFMKPPSTPFPRRRVLAD